jgi:ABC-type polysaccharide/polyol phosphate transport system ATPase subunit
MSAVAVDARNLTKHYRLGELRSLRKTLNTLRGRRTAPSAGIEALSEVSFTVAQGEALGIVGTNGSGKSTVLQILAGTTLPTSGEMRVRGRLLPLLSVVHGFHPELTGRENVTLFSTSLGFRPDTSASRMNAVADFAGLGKHMDTPLKRFSSGMVSRLAFAVAMQFPADVYVFDEVLAVVDHEFQLVCLDEIKRLHREGRTVIFVSHDEDQVADVCDRVLWLEKGAVRDLGATADVLAAYAREHEAADESTASC